jgi:flagellar biosynthesis/type III secretory pathway chaperone
MIAFDEVLARLDNLAALLIEERELLERSDIAGLEGMMVRKEALLNALFSSETEPEAQGNAQRLNDARFSVEQRGLLEDRFQGLMRENTINGALIDSARVRASSMAALLASRGPNAVYGDRGRLRGPTTGTRLTRTA